MSEAELAILRPRVSELEHHLALERHHHQETRDQLTAARAQIAALMAEVRALRADRTDVTPEPSVAHPPTEPIVRKSREHA